jgi:hypothetical protein
MGKIIRKDNRRAYQQDDGEITAWFPESEERMELSHEGDPRYKKIFFLLVMAGLLYLILIFTIF